MGTKTKTSKRNPKIIIAICLALLLLVAIGASTFAWIRNYVGVEQMSLTTGKMLYKITLYQKDDGVYKSTPLFDTGDGSDPTEIPKNLETQIEAAKQQINVKPGEEVFFVVEKYPNSIDLDVSLAFEKDGDEDQYKYMGQTIFKMMDDSASFDTKMDAEGGNVDNAISNLANDADKPNGADPKNMNAIWETVQKTRSLDSAASNACIRLAFVQDPSNQSNDVLDSTFPLNLKFCVSQKGAKDVASGARLDVTRIEDLPKTMESYGFNDEIYITGVGTEAEPAEVNGDLVFTRPCKIVLNRSYIKVNGNLIFSYAYDADFSLDTISDGHIYVRENFQIDLPNSRIDLLGANNVAAGKADVYVEKNFVANASRLETRGLNIKGMRVCDDNDALKPLTINGDTRLTTANRTQIGKLSVENYGENHGFAIEIDNRGSIEQIDLTNMIQNKNMRKTPCILIDNSGTIVDSTILLPDWAERFELSDDKNTPDDKTDDEFVGNTRIIANKGSSKMYAVTPHFINEGTVNWPADSAELTKFFISNRDKDYGTRDDIEYAVRDTFIDVLERDENGNATSIVIHYEVPSEEAVRNNANLAELVPVGTENISLYKYLEFYGYMTSKGGVLPITLLNDVKIICYGDKALDGNANNPDASGYKSEDHINDYLTDDYACIRKMENLENLDLSDAMSKVVDITLRDPSINSKADITETHRTVPEGAFRGMSKLSKVLMSESDTAWGRNLFLDTTVDEITFPQALVRLLNTRYTEAESKINHGKVKAQDVLTGVKYVYTSITLLDGFYANKSSAQYYFVPDESSYLAYKNFYKDNSWYSKIFMNNGVVRYEKDRDLFIRYDSESTRCEFVVYAGNSETWTEGFDFSTLNIGGKIYDIVSYDPYALYEKLSNIENTLDIEFGEKLEIIGQQAFSLNSKIRSVTFDGNTKLMGYCFLTNTSLESVDAPYVTTLEGGYNFYNNIKLKTFYMPSLRYVSGNNDLDSCVLLERIDISIIKYTTANKNFYPCSDSYNYAKIYIHTENLTEEDVKEIKEGANGNARYSAALGATQRHIFVPHEYVYLYIASANNYTGVSDIGNNSVNTIKEVVIDNIEYCYVTLSETEVCILACFDKSIDMSDEPSYDIPGSFVVDGKTYTVKKIGSAAYHFTEINAKELNIPASVEEIGQYAFDAEMPSFKKRIGTVNLPSVIKAEKRAFYAVEMLVINAPLLEEVGEKALAKNEKMLIAVLPMLKTGNGMFEEAYELRVAYLGFSNNTIYNSTSSLRNNYVRVLNDLGRKVGAAGKLTTETKKSVPNVNTIVNSPLARNTSSVHNMTMTEDPNYKYSDNIYFSDYYEKVEEFEFSVDVNGVKTTKTMTVSVSLPTYVFFEHDDGKLTLFAVSPDVEMFGNYVTPGYLDVANNEVVDKPNSDTMPVTKIGKYAYGVVEMGGKITSLTTGEAVNVIEDAAFRGSSYRGSNLYNSVLGAGVVSLDLAKVVEIGGYVFYEAQFENLRADSLQSIGKYAFAKCTGIQTVYLPAFKEVTGENSFSNCSSLVDVTLGENASVLSYGMFSGVKTLKKITILNATDVVTLKSFASVETKIAPNSSPTVYLHGEIHDDYLSAYNNNFGGIASNKLLKYGNTTEYTNNNITIRCYWEEVGSDAAYIDFIDFVSIDATATSFVLPQTIDGRKVVSVSSAAISAMSLISKLDTLTLPSQMQYLTFTAAALPDTVEKLIISEDNDFFMTDANGVLYSEDGKILYAYPKARESTSFTVNLGVEQIFDEAFYGAKTLKEITIDGTVVINDKAFANAALIETVDFTDMTASTFAGRDIFGGVYSEDFKITVPGSVIDAYKANVLIDYSIVGKIKAR